MDPIGKILMIVGAGIFLAGFSWHMGWFQALHLGSLPGDIRIERENMRIYFPLTTGLLLSLVATLIAWLLRG